MQSMSHSVPLFCAPRWPSCHVIENHLCFTSFSLQVFQTVWFNLYKFHSFVGTDKQGFGFGGTGKKSFGRQFDTYGEVHDLF